jgi:two-component system, NarL family, response regulator LiaR
MIGPEPRQPPSPIRLLIVDDHTIVRHGLVAILAEVQDIQVVGEASDGDFAIDQCRKHCPDVVLMDIRMPRKGGIEATRLIRVMCPAAQIIAITSYMVEAEMQAALQAGVISILVKNITADALVRAVRQAHDGLSTLAPEMVQLMVQSLRGPVAPVFDLTLRELDVLAVMVEGLSNREIGQRLSISQATVKNHVSNIMSKLHTTNRTQTVALAVEYKLLHE